MTASAVVARTIRRLLALHEDEEAGRLLEDALDRWPRHPRFRRMQGEWQWRQGNSDGALRTLQRAHADYPLRLDLAERLVELHLSRGETADAETVLGPWLDREPDSASLRRLAAEAAAQRSEPERVLDHLYHAIAYGDNARVARRVVAVAPRLGVAPRAVHELGEEAAARWPDEPAILKVAASAAKRAGELEVAARHWARLADYTRGDPIAPLQQAIHLVQLGEMERAEQVFRAVDPAVPRKPREVRLWFKAAMAIGDSGAASRRALELAQERAIEPEVRFIVADALVLAGEYSPATSVFETLLRGDDPELSRRAERRIGGIWRLLSGAEAAPAPFAKKDAEFLHHPIDGADTTLLIFTGLANQTPLLELLHPMLSRFGVSLVCLRDRQRLLYLNGVSELGADYRETLSAIRALCGSNHRRFLCFGSSAGGYAALRYGMDLGASRVLAMCAPTNLEVEACSVDGRARAVGARLHKRVPQMAVDLRPLYAATPDAPRVDVWYGEGHVQDRWHAEHMQGLPGVHLHPVADCDEHNVLWRLIAEGRAEPVFREFLGSD